MPKKKNQGELLVDELLQEGFDFDQITAYLDLREKNGELFPHIKKKAMDRVADLRRQQGGEAAKSVYAAAARGEMDRRSPPMPKKIKIPDPLSKSAQKARNAAVSLAQERVSKVLAGMGFTPDDMREILGGVGAAARSGKDQVLSISHPLDPDIVSALEKIGFRAQASPGGHYPARLVATGHMALTPKELDAVRVGMPTPVSSPAPASESIYAAAARGDLKEKRPRRTRGARRVPDVPGLFEEEKGPWATGSGVPSYERMGSTPSGVVGLEEALGWGRSQKPSAAPGPSPELHSVPLPSGIRKGRRAAARLSSMMEASGIEGEGSFLQKGAAKLAQSLGADASVLGGGGKISGILGSIVRGAIKHPIIAATDVVGMGLPLLGLGKDAVNAVSRGVTGDPLIGGISTDQALRMEAEVRKEQRRREVENQARAQRLAQNTVSLIQNAPLVAQQIMAGRRLPKGAVVIGGTPRVDLMQQMADQMSQGAFQNQDPLQQLAMEQ